MPAGVGDRTTQSRVCSECLTCFRATEIGNGQHVELQQGKSAKAPPVLVISLQSKRATDALSRRWVHENLADAPRSKTD